MNWYDLWEEQFDGLQWDLKCARLSSYSPPCAQHSRPSALCTALVVKEKSRKYSHVCRGAGYINAGTSVQWDIKPFQRMRHSTRTRVKQSPICKVKNQKRYEEVCLVCSHLWKTHNRIHIHWRAVGVHLSWITRSVNPCVVRKLCLSPERRT